MACECNEDDNPEPPALEIPQDENQLFYFDSDTSLTNAEIMAFENDSTTFDITQRFWQAWLIDRLIEDGEDVKALRESINYATTLDRQADTESRQWMINVANEFTEDNIIYEPFTEEIKSVRIGLMKVDAHVPRHRAITAIGFDWARNAASGLETAIKSNSLPSIWAFCDLAGQRLPKRSIWNNNTWTIWLISARISNSLFNYLALPGLEPAQFSVCRACTYHNIDGFRNSFQHPTLDPAFPWKLHLIFISVRGRARNPFQSKRSIL